jgi:DNA-binding NarL/FixJ family response regulator
MSNPGKKLISRVDKILVGVLEDDAATRDILAGWFRRTKDIEMLWGNGDGEAALRSLSQNSPDVVLTDINLPGMNGIEFVRQAKLAAADTQFLMVTVYEDVDHIFAALAAGATGYLLKRTPRNELLSAVREAHAGASPMNGHIARKVVELFRERAGAADQVISLSPRENEVLGLLAKGFLYKEIGVQLGISVFTVNNFIRRIYEKLHVTTRGQAVAKLHRTQSPGSTSKLNSSL